MLIEVLLCAVAFLVFKYTYKRWKYDLHKIPTVPGLPIPGHKHTLSFLMAKTMDPTKIRAAWLKDLGDPEIMLVEVAGRRMLFLYSQDCCREVTANPNKFLKLKTFALKEVVGEGCSEMLLVRPSVEPYVKAIRSTYMIAFQSQNIKAQTPKLFSVADKLMSVIESEREKGPIDFQELCVRATLDTIGAFLFDSNLGGLDRSRDFYSLIIETGHIRRMNINSSIKHYMRCLFPRSKSAREAQKVIDMLQMEWCKLTEDIQRRESPLEGEQPFWHNLRELINPETGQKLSGVELKVEIALAVVAGMDTTGHQLAWILSAIAAHPAVEQKIMIELEENGLLKRDVIYDDTFDLKYLTAVIKEGMRLVYVVASVIPRLVAEDTTLGGYRIPKGTLIVPTGNRRANFARDWGDPGVFRPERWLAGENMSKKHYLAFSYGPRDCVGQRLAMLEMRLFLVKILSKYKLEPTMPFEDLIENTTAGLTIEANNGNWLKALPRTFSG